MEIFINLLPQRDSEEEEPKPKPKPELEDWVDLMDTTVMRFLLTSFEHLVDDDVMMLTSQDVELNLFKNDVETLSS